MAFKPITKEQVISNISRTIKEGLISLLSDKEINKLSLKYYGIKGDNGEYIAFVDPYSGEVVTDEKIMALDHILPVCLGGGTVLFNCIPVKADINTSKNGSYILEWWKKQEYYSEDKLEKLVEYMLEAYEITFDETKVDKLFMANSNEDYEEINRHLVEEAPLDKTQKELQKVREKGKIKHSYKELMENLISEVKEENKKKNYEERLKALNNKNIFEEIEEYIYIINIFKKLIVEYLKSIDEYSDYHEETILTKCNFKKLHKNLKKNYPKEKWEEEITRRLKIIEEYLNEDNLTLSSYYENLDKDKHLIQSEEITKEEYKKFKGKIKASKYDKFRLLIEFVNQTGRLPSTGKNSSELEKTLRQFLNRIQTKNKLKDGYSMTILLSTRDLIRLATSEYEILRNVYKEIKKTYKENHMNIRKYKKAFDKIEELELSDQMPEIKYYEDNETFNTLIEFANQTGRLPSQGKKSTELEKTLRQFLSGIQSRQELKDGYSMTILLSTRDLIRLATSEYEILRNVYKEIKKTYKENHMNIRKYKKAFDKIEELELSDQMPEIKYYEDNETFNTLIEFANQTGRLPSQGKNSSELEKTLGKFLNKLQSRNQLKDGYSMGILLSTRDLIRLATSEYECLRNVYEEIEETYKQNNMNIRKYKKAFDKIEELELSGQMPEIKYYEENEKFNMLIDFVNQTGRLPKQSGVKEEPEKTLGQFLSGIQARQELKDGYSMNSLLSTRDLIRLATSDYESLRNIYEEIEETYKDNNMNIRKYKKAFDKIDELELTGQMPEIKYYEENEKFNMLIEFVNQTGRLPSTGKNSSELEKTLGKFLNSIKSRQKLKDRYSMETLLSTRDLIRLATSDNPLLKDVFNKIKKIYEDNHIYIRKYEKAFDYVDSLEKNKRKTA